MIDTKRARDIVRALRCTSTAGEECAGNACQYWVDVKVSDKIGDLISEITGDDVWRRCDVDRVGTDAAEMIEALLADNERMSDLLMVMRIKMTGDCGVCRHQHVNVREEPCASCIMTEGRDGWQYEGDEEHGEP